MRPPSESAADEARRIRSASAVVRAADAAERQANAAVNANTKATIALIISAISMIVTIVGIWIVHIDSLHPSLVGIDAHASQTHR